jgi:hypothetical protein
MGFSNAFYQALPRTAAALTRIPVAPERHPELVRDELLVRYRAERIEPPAAIPHQTARRLERGGTP